MTVSRKTVTAGIKLAVFTAVSLVVTGTLVAIMGRFGSGETAEYSAIFKNASLLQKGDDVRVAGVVMGKVQDVEIYESDAAKVDLLASPRTCRSPTRPAVEIRYLNLVGDRYVTVDEGKPGGAERSRRAPRSRSSGPRRRST